MKMDDAIIFKSNQKRIQLYPSSQGGPLVIYHAVHGEGEDLWKSCQQMNCPAFSLAIINDVDWNHEMSPWPIPPIAKNDIPCSGGADEYLQTFIGEMVPRICDELSSPPTYCALSGYSLAGLFSVYAAFRTDRFERIASASGSLWYPDFISFVEEHQISNQIQVMYFSLGDIESHTKNPYLAPVEENIRWLMEYFRSKGITTTFKLNRGNHFQDAVPRMAAGIKWMLEQEGRND